MAVEQIGFDFEDKDLKVEREKNLKIIQEHNDKFFKKTEEKWIKVDLKKILDYKESQDHAMLYVRVLLNKALKNCQTRGNLINKNQFMQLVAHEMRMKTINRNLILELVDHLLQNKN